MVARVVSYFEMAKTKRPDRRPSIGRGGGENEPAKSYVNSTHAARRESYGATSGGMCARIICVTTWRALTTSALRLYALEGA